MRDLEFIAQRLRDRLPGGASLRRVVALSAGHSNETYLLEGLDRVLRMPPSSEGLLPTYDMGRQYAVLARVHSCADSPPVPAVFDLCEDPRLIGAPFFTMQWLPGESFEYVLPQWIVDGAAEATSAVCAQWIDAVLRVANVPFDGLPLPARAPVEEVAHWRDVARGADAPRELVDLLDALHSSPPRASGAQVLVHGDAKYANCQWQHGRLVGLFDWEMTHVGDPLFDLGYLISFFSKRSARVAMFGFRQEGWWPRSRIVDTWEQRTGRRAVDLHLHEAVAMCKIAAILALGIALHRRGGSHDDRFAYWSTALGPYVETIRKRLDSGAAM